jgi:hypothetical protein
MLAAAKARRDQAVLFLEGREFRPEFFDRFGDGDASVAENAELTSFGESERTCEDRRRETPVRLDDVCRCGVRDQPGQVQDVAERTERTAEADPLWGSLSRESICGQPVVETLEVRIGRREMDRRDLVERDRRGAHEARFERCEEGTREASAEWNLRQDVHFGMSHHRSGQVCRRSFGCPIAPPRNHRSRFVDEHGTNACRTGGPRFPGLIECELPGQAQGFPSRCRIHAAMVGPLVRSARGFLCWHAPANCADWAPLKAARAPVRSSPKIRLPTAFSRWKLGARFISLSGLSNTGERDACNLGYLASRALWAA